MCFFMKCFTLCEASVSSIYLFEYFILAYSVFLFSVKEKLYIHSYKRDLLRLKLTGQAIIPTLTLILLIKGIMYLDHWIWQVKWHQKYWKLMQNFWDYYLFTTVQLELLYFYKLVMAILWLFIWFLYSFWICILSLLWEMNFLYVTLHKNLSL